ncbi:tRNA preQ1(34) S-adenosylmethionine ribosyltransferase-isomerase QueA [Dissulfurirhabdus thermomarina]|uniref:S-adenosylmethionine:tRNA ribosyltransferase-isomerase n=1 Tax=Dissulfurirhabdus thermomarina TaxID=1765737 RepID=A0A6N9TQY0_DISTH|nr:tRNA preQ1(34) S-adenosylmethionine ribosyltransferase-isomerase QueA [Dissulfurirhabdus thermomarina]NDY42513.1 tRNA preQ1(34) S-adenosylmethionine ribosyltransferase-isomerase QueA [Dissulfurirhabdus thermomarina]NMX24200.1 tRNA preQ1(34) S-adenosylmethionine ribosyltransferase-isomerase QueA [Dissulfurirhabdus thermomarina]
MTRGFSLSEYDYPLPESAIARYPAPRRTGSRLLVMDRRTGRLADRRFAEVGAYLRPGDCLVLNDTAVFPARLRGRKPTGGRVELLLLGFPREAGDGTAEARALCRASKGLRAGQRVEVAPDLEVEVLAVEGGGEARVRLHYRGGLARVLDRRGEVPLPPYIRRAPEAPDRRRYQTVYAARTGSVAAPTAGLHFSRGLLEEIRAAGVRVARVTLHVGYGTFAPIRVDDVRAHRIHEEWVSVPAEAVAAVAETRRAGGRVVAVGTTTVRALEWAAEGEGGLEPREGACGLYILPGHRFRVVDALVTNFHLPRSSLLVLVAAFAGLDPVLRAYAHARDRGYRFYSYGDAMLIL